MAVRTAAGHMQQIADSLAEAIVKQFSDKFGG
jgi:S-adenosylmethionine synthetase